MIYIAWGTPNKRDSEGKPGGSGFNKRLPLNISLGLGEKYSGIELNLSVKFIG
jgi:hypothetical protein